MSQKTAKTDYKQMILTAPPPAEAPPRALVASISGWYFLFFSPLSETTAATTPRIASERKRVATAREIEQLKKALAPFQGRVPAGADINELMRHVIDHIRSSPLKLLDLKPEKPKDLGPYETMASS